MKTYKNQFSQQQFKHEKHQLAVQILKNSFETFFIMKKLYLIASCDQFSKTKMRNHNTKEKNLILCSIKRKNNHHGKRRASENEVPSSIKEKEEPNFHKEKVDPKKHLERSTLECKDTHEPQCSAVCTQITIWETRGYDQT